MVKKKKPLYTFEYYVDAKAEIRWRCRHRNGNIITDSGESYKNRVDASRALQNLLVNVRSDNYQVIPLGKQS